MIIRSIWRNTAGLGLVALISAGLIALTHQTTEDQIERNARAWSTRVLYELVPPTHFDQPLEQHAFVWPDQTELLTTLGTAGPGYRALREHRVQAVVLPVISREGYSGAIDLLVAIDREGQLLGVRVLSHLETPGLGDAIEADRSDWIFQFDGQSFNLTPPADWELQKSGGEFDQVSGATITSRAVLYAVRRALRAFQSHRPVLLAPTGPAHPAKEDN